MSWADGEVLAYARLAARLGPERPVYGLRRDRLEDRRPRHTRVEEMAAQYVEEILAVRPAGPYHLGGLSGAPSWPSRWRSSSVPRGTKWALSSSWSRRGSEAGTDGAEREASDPAQPSQHRRAREEGPRSVGEVAAVERRRSGSPISAGRPRSSGGKDARGPSRDPPEDVLDHVEPYVPRAYSGRATLVLARHERFRRERLREWQALVTGGLEVRVVPGIHAAIVQEPFVRVLARRSRNASRPSRPDR